MYEESTGDKTVSWGKSSTWVECLSSWFFLSSQPARYAIQQVLQPTFKHVPAANRVEC